MIQTNSFESCLGIGTTHGPSHLRFLIILCSVRCCFRRNLLDLFPPFPPLPSDRFGTNSLIPFSHISKTLSTPKQKRNKNNDGEWMHKGRKNTEGKRKGTTAKRQKKVGTFAMSGLRMVESKTVDWDGNHNQAAPNILARQVVLR